MVTNNKRLAASQNNILPKNMHQKADSVSFSGNQQSILSKLLSAFKSKEKPVISEAFFHGKLADFSEHREDCFMIFSPEGKLVHKQRKNDYTVKPKTIKAQKGNIVLLRQNGEKLNLEQVLSQFLTGTKQIFVSHDVKVEPVSLNNPTKNRPHHQVITYPELTKDNEKNATRMLGHLIQTLDDEAHNLVMMQALQTGGPVICNDMGGLMEKIRPHVEEPLFNKYNQKLGIKVTDVPA